MESIVHGAITVAINVSDGDGNGRRAGSDSDGGGERNKVVGGDPVHDDNQTLLNWVMWQQLHHQKLL